jgi:NADPH:quinone reductase
MKAIFLEKPGGPLVLKDVEIPVPAKGEVLVKINAAPVNPSDIARIKNAHLEYDLNTFIPGIEASGKVVKAGRGILPAFWLGKRVACSSEHSYSGTWAEYMVTSAAKCFPLSDKVSDEQGSMSLVNPLTAIAFFEIAEKEGHKAIINNAAASALGRMVELLGDRKNIPVINIVRKQEQADTLTRLGSKHVLVSSNPQFYEQLTKLSEELKATILFDSVCGRQFSSLISVLPYGSRVIVYGNLSGDEHPEFDPRVILGKKITIEGFYLANRAKENGIIKNILNLRKVSKLMQTGLSVKIRERFPLSMGQKAVDAYLADMSAGKVLLMPTR